MKQILLVFSGFLIGIPLFGQSLSFDPTGVFAKCPNEWINYTVTNTSTAACTYGWTVTNGEIQGGVLNGSVSTFTGGTLIQIKWFDVTSGGSVSAVANCSPSSGNGSRTISIPILSINGVNPSAITGSSTVIVNVTTNQTYSVDQINFPNIGTGDVNPKQVSGYEWEIPTGWTVVTGGNTKSITLTPDNCSGGNIRVRGKNSNCTSGTFYTSWSTVKAVTRTLSNPTTISGPANVVCSDVSLKTYSIASVTGATSYTWTLPLGWSGSSSTNLINVTPNGLNGGSITAKANGCTLQSQASTLSVVLNLFDPINPPQISGTNPICTSTTFSLTNQPPNTTVGWTGTFTTGLVINSGTGLATRQNSLNGYSTVTATISGSCGSFSVTKNMVVGTPYLQTGSSSLCNDRQSNVFYYSNSPLAYTWEVFDTSNELVDGGAGTSFSVYGGQLGLGTYKVKAGATSCTPYNKWRQTTVTVRNCGSFAGLTVDAYPNPAVNTLTVELTDSLSSKSKKPINLDEPYHLSIMDKYSQNVFTRESSERKIVIPTEALIPDTYYLIVQYKDVVLKRKIITNK